MHYRDAIYLVGLLRKEKRDFTRADDGKFSESPGSGGKKSKAKKPKAKGTPQEIANQNRAKMAESTGLGSDLDGAMARLNAGMGGVSDEAKADQLVERGLATKDPDTGRYSLSPDGKKYYAAAKKGDTEAATAALADGKGRAEKTKASADKAKEKADAKVKATEDKAKAKEEKEKAKGGGGGGKAKPEEKPKPEKEKKTPKASPAEVKAKNRADVAQAMADSDQGLAPAGARNLMDFADGKPLDADGAKSLAAMGLLTADKSGGYRLSAAGKAASTAMNRGDLRGTLDAISTGVDSMSKSNFFFALDPDSLTKAETDECTVVGYASTPDIDDQPGVYKGQRYDGDIVDSQALADSLDDYMQWANIRDMHEAKAVGTVVKAEMLPDGRLKIVARIVDSEAVKKVRAGVYKGFSIGGRLIKAILQELEDGRIARRITKLLLTEISLVDRPANPGAKILLFKGADMSNTDALASLTELLTLAKAAPDPMKVVAQIQNMRNEIELAGDSEGANLLTQAINLVMQAAGEADPIEGSPEEETAEPADEAAAEGDVAMMAGDEEEDPAMVAMAARVTLLKASRLRMGKRLPGIEALAKSMLQLAADGGSEWAAKLLKAASAESEGTTDVAVKALGSELKKSTQVIAGGLVDIIERIKVIEAQPQANAPIQRVVTGSVQKRLDSHVEIKEVAAIDPDRVAELRRLSITEVHPARRESYRSELARLTGL